MGKRKAERLNSSRTVGLGFDDLDNLDMYRLGPCDLHTVTFSFNRCSCYPTMGRLARKSVKEERNDTESRSNTTLTLLEQGIVHLPVRVL